MTINEIEKIKEIVVEGTYVIVPNHMLSFNPDDKESRIARVCGLYRNVFAVKYSNGITQCFKYQDYPVVAKMR